jgi:phage antirepressor YoqD-like protein
VATATKAKKAPTAPVVEAEVETDDDEELEGLDEVEATAEASQAEAAPKKTGGKKKKAAEKPARVGMSTKDAAALLDITPQRLRRILRSEDGGYQDGDYTRYDLTEADIERIRGLIQAGTAEKRTRKAKATAEGEEATAAEEVTEELANLEEDDEEEEELDLGEDTDAEDDDDE